MAARGGAAALGSASASDGLGQDAGPSGPPGQDAVQAEGHSDEAPVEDHTEATVEGSEPSPGQDTGQDLSQDGSQGAASASASASAPSVRSSQDADDANEGDSEEGTGVEEAGRPGPGQPKPAERGSRRRPSARSGRSRGRGRTSEDENEDEDACGSESEPGLRLGLRILQDLMNTNSTFLSYPDAKKGMVDYHDVIEEPMWFLEIQRRFDNAEYPSIADFVKDVRLLLLNTYRYFGPDALETRRALRIEHVLEMKLAALPKDLKNQCSLMSTHGIQSRNDEDEQISRKSADFVSHLLESVAEDRNEREKNRTHILEEGRLLDKEGRGKEILQWEVKVLLAPPAVTQMRTMWEIPLIGHLLQLTVQILCIEQVPQYEVERMFLMPQASKTLAVLMTSLLSPPLQRTKLYLMPPMPYSIWSRKLSQRVAVWYKMFQTRNRDWAKIFELCGIEKDFWTILGDWNQLEDYEFHELSFHQRVWLIKTLGDYLVHNHKTMQDALADHSQKELNCESLGEDRHGRQYLHFPQFCSAPGLSTCVRVYRCVIPEEKARSPDITQEISRVEVRTERRNFLPSWMKNRVRGKARNIKSIQATKKKLGAEINSKKFLSRIVYRMPNGMHIGGRRKRGANRLPDRALNVQPEEEESQQAACRTTLDSSVPSADQPTASKDKSQLAITESTGTHLTRQTRSSRKTSQGFYADWSDSDSLSSPSPSSSYSKSLTSRQSSVSLSIKPSNSKSIGAKMRLRASRKRDRVPSLKHSDESQSGISDDEKNYKALDPDEDASSHESGCEGGINRNLWSMPDSVKKEDDDSDEDNKNNRPENQEKEDCDLSLTEDFPWISSDKELSRKNKEKRPHFNPVWMLLGAEHFELVADSVQGVRDLVESLCEDDDDLDLSQRLKKQTRSWSGQPLCEKNLEHRLSALINEIEFLEVKMERNTRQLRWKLFEEWENFKNIPKDETEKAESFWLSILEKGMEENSILERSREIKEEEIVHNSNGAVDLNADKEKHGQQNLELQDDNSQTGGEIRHSLRAKRLKIENASSTWLNSGTEDESSDNEKDDAWVMPGKRRKKRSNAGRSRKNPRDTKSDDEAGEKVSSKKTCEKSQGVAKNFSFESCSFGKEPSQTEGTATQILKDYLEPKINQKKMLPNKLTLDKEGNMFITLGCGTKVHLKKDEDGRIIVPEGHEGLSMISGKTLDQLLGSGKVVQNKKRKPSRPAKRSTTLFPASSQPTEIVQAKEWTPPIMKNPTQVREVQKLKRGPSVQAKEWTPPLDAKLTPPLKVISSSSSIGPQLKTYANRKQKEGNQTLVGAPKIAPQTKKASGPDEVVVLSDGSDDSIEVIKETEPKSSDQSVVPRIESVIGNATDSFASKPLTKSVTMTPVIKSSSNSSSGKSKQWSPVISNTISLEPVSSSGRIRSPGAPQVVILPAKNVPARRNLQQTGVFNQPTSNQSFVPMNTIPMRQAQSQFVPLNQMVSVNNQFQPVTQVVGMGNQYVLTNNPFSPMGNQYVMNTTPSFQYVPVAPAPMPLPLPVSAFDVGLPPGLTGQIVLANGDNNQFSYAFKLDDGGLIFLSNEQVSRIRAANGGRLTTMVQFQTQ